jgi:PBSX family phage portal protein
MSDHESASTPAKTVVSIDSAISKIESMKRIRKMRDDRLVSVAGGSVHPTTVEVAKNAEMAGSTTPDKTTLKTPDQVTSLTESGRLILPPYNLRELSTLREYSSELGQCLEAMTVNIEGYGHRYVPRIDMKAAPEDVKNDAKQELAEMQNFFEYVDVDEGFVALRLKTRMDIESNGNGFWEVIRNVGGEIVEFKHVPSYQMRLGRVEETQVLVSTPVLKVQPDGEMVVDTIDRYKRFRQYFQIRGLSSVAAGSLKTSTTGAVWFKEFQDPRAYDNTTGDIIEDGGDIEKARQDGKLANEMIHFALYSPRSAYGIPRFIGNMLGIYGDRAAEEINYITFQNNNIPSMVVSVTNGQLTGGTIDRIESFVESQIQGKDNYSKFLVVEAEGFVEGEDSGQIKIEIKPLTREQHTDAMFNEYSKGNRDSIRRSFRLPPILVGRAEDYTRATADASVKLADEQVFAPARNIVDDFINRRVFPEKGYRFHKFRSNSPDTTDNSELVKILSTAEKTGGMTPNIARSMLSDILSRPLGPVSEDIEGDIPFSLQMAEAVKNQADPAEPGQQVTALKIMDMLTGSEEHDDDVSVTKGAAKGILSVRETIEKKLRDLATAGTEPHAHD